ncbi:MAG: CHASE2 domain-containing protein [Desulfobulbaceae bacterium]|nr:CHASE2 domain-containing protein [Desulfobulbaceae bacterium]
MRDSGKTIYGQTLKKAAGSSIWQFFKFTKPEDRKSIALSGILFTSLFLALAVFRIDFLADLDQKLYDFHHRSLHNPAAPMPLIVDIDEKSLAEFGQWPWPRHRIAALLNKLTNAGAGSVGLDIIFAEPDRTSLKVVQQEFREGTGLKLNLAGIPNHLHSNDDILAQALAQGPFVLGFKFLASDDGKIPVGIKPVSVAILNEANSNEAPLRLLSGIGAVVPLPELSRAAGHTGFLNVSPDNDGVIRRVPLLMRFQDRIYPSLALASVMKALGTNSIYLNISSLGLESLRLGTTVVPIDAAANLLVRYRGGSRSFDYISAADLLNGRIDLKRIAGRVVFVGTSAAGLKDTVTTPLSTLYPGVEVHASVADNILNQQFLERPAWTTVAELILIFVAGTLISIIMAWSRPLTALLYLAIEATLFWFGGLWSLHLNNVYVSQFYPLLALAGNYSFLNILKLRLAEKRASQRNREMQRIESELNVARDIQMGFLPKTFPPFPEHKEFDIFASLIPAREVGGDLFDFFFIDADHLCFSLGDVSDKGVPAALFMATTRTLVKTSAKYCPSPAEMMTRINDALCQDNPESMFVTLVIGVLNIRTGKIIYVNGGHNPPLLIGKDGDVSYKRDKSGPMVGAMAEIPYKEISFTLAPENAIFLYTDGVTEAMNENDEQFSDKRLLQEVTALQAQPVEKVISEIFKKVRKHAGARSQSDDITMLMIRYNTPAVKKQPPITS